MKDILSIYYSEMWNLKKIKRLTMLVRIRKGLELLRELRKTDCLYAYSPFGT